MVKIEDLKKIYPGKVPTPALNGVSFDIEDGEFIAVMGRSGSGKSTLLHQLGLLDNPTEGHIFINGINTSHLSDSSRGEFRLKHIGYVFQEYALMPEFTALQNVYLPAMSMRQSSRKYKERAAELLSMVGLKERIEHYPSELSGGEQQRVAIARALIAEPQLILADEPTASLDTYSAKIVLELFLELNKKLKQTIVMVTHEPEDRKYADRVMWLKDGLLEKAESVRHREASHGRN